MKPRLRFYRPGWSLPGRHLVLAGTCQYQTPLVFTEAPTGLRVLTFSLLLETKNWRQKLRIAHGLGTHSTGADLGGFLEDGVRLVGLCPNSPKLCFPNYSTVFTTSESGQKTNGFANASPRVVLSRHLSSRSCTGFRIASKEAQS